MCKLRTPPRVLTLDLPLLLPVQLEKDMINEIKLEIRPSIFTFKERKVRFRMFFPINDENTSLPRPSQVCMLDS